MLTLEFGGLLCHWQYRPVWLAAGGSKQLHSTLLYYERDAGSDVDI